MIAQRQIARAASRFTARARGQAQRRFASTEAENSFVRERRHVKEHAQATTGQPAPPPPPSPRCPIEGRNANPHTELWRKISL